MLISALTLGATALGGPMAGVIAGTAMGVIGALGEGQSAKAEAKYQAELARYNQRVNEQEAKATEMKARFDQIQQQRRGRRVQGATRAKLGASGALMTEGAPIAILGAQASELALENAMIGYEGMTEAQKFRSQGALDYAQSKIYEQRGRSAERASYWKAGSSLLSGFGTAYSSGMFGLGQAKTVQPKTYLTSSIGQSIYPAH